jgi:hypothetical protein
MGSASEELTERSVYKIQSSDYPRFSIIRTFPPPPLARIIENTLQFQQYFSSLQSAKQWKVPRAYEPLKPALGPSPTVSAASCGRAYAANLEGLNNPGLEESLGG